MGRKKIYFTEEERRTARRVAKRRWREAHPDYNVEYRKNNKEKIVEKKAEWKKNNPDYEVERNKTPKGRANNLLKAYRAADIKRNRGECTLTAEWIIQNIFAQPCHYCGKTDWHELGCDRIDNTLPHTPENVVPCCWECNRKKGTTPYEEYLKLIGKSDTD